MPFCSPEASAEPLLWYRDPEPLRAAAELLPTVKSGEQTQKLCYFIDLFVALALALAEPDSFQLHRDLIRHIYMYIYQYVEQDL